MISLPHLNSQNRSVDIKSSFHGKFKERLVQFVVKYGVIGLLACVLIEAMGWILSRNGTSPRGAVESYPEVAGGENTANNGCCLSLLSTRWPLLEVTAM